MLASPPNILLLVSDDQANVAFSRSWMPNVFSQLVDRGALFTRAYVNESMCCPSRSQIMTGLYAHHTGVDSNEIPLNRPTIIQKLHDMGYGTMLAGKFLNSMPCDPRPEFDRWICYAVPPHYSYSMVNPWLNVDGRWRRFKGYTTDILANFMAKYISHTPETQPFFAMYTPTSPHLPANDPRCRRIPVPPYRPPSFDEDTKTDRKPQYLHRRSLTQGEIDQLDREHRRMTQAVTCLDNSIQTVLASLGPREQNTLVFYISDNGFLYGEQRREGKSVPYEDSVRVPFVVRYPPLRPEDQPISSEALVENVDIAATIADILGFHWGADGMSLVPLLTQSQQHIRGAGLIEYCEGPTYPCAPGFSGVDNHIFQRAVPSFYGLVTARFKYVEYVTGERELYDIQSDADPFELKNHAGEPKWTEVQASLAAMLANLTAPPLVDTTIVTGPSGTVPPGSYVFTYFSQSRFATYECRLDQDGSPGTWFPCDGQSVTIGPLGPGSYTFLVRGTDETGSTDPTPAMQSFNVA